MKTKLLILPLLWYIPFINSDPLSVYISHHEKLNYQTNSFDNNYIRTKKSAPVEHNVSIKFNALGNSFHIRLKRDTNVFSDNLVMESNNKKIKVDMSHIYNGNIVGDDKSFVFGSIINGIFEGKIITSNNSYYVENAKNYFPNRSQEDNFHSVIYEENNVKDPYSDDHDNSYLGGCGLTDEVQKWMEHIQNLPTVENTDDINESNSSAINNFTVNLNESQNINFTKDTLIEKSESENERQKRNIQNDIYTCSLYIQTDHTVWNYIREHIASHDNGTNSEIDEKTRREIFQIIANHITSVNYIYRNTKFNIETIKHSIRFEVMHIKIDDNSSCSEAINEYPFCDNTLNIFNVLDLHSLRNHEMFCLAYLFTYRDFVGGKLGCSWVGSISGSSAGVCGKHKTYIERVGTLFKSTKRSLNTGVITFRKYNSRVPPKISQIMLAHEIGHSTGSLHDSTFECSPGGVAGNFIMFSGATNGNLPNNNKFSTCSIKNISSFLNSISQNRNCFHRLKDGFCGNNIIEKDEECDCGFSEEDCVDKCCYPRNISEKDFILNHTAKGCTRRAKTQCSPSEGPCCLSKTCHYIPANENVICREETDCTLNSTCNGEMSECPESPNKSNNIFCNNGTQLCKNGDCSASLCQLWNMTECFFKSSDASNYDIMTLCEVSCQNGNDTLSCRGTSDLARLFDLPVGGIRLKNGAPCDDFRGYCDSSSVCRPIGRGSSFFNSSNELI